MAVRAAVAEYSRALLTNQQTQKKSASSGQRDKTNPRRKVGKGKCKSSNDNEESERISEKPKNRYVQKKQRENKTPDKNKTRDRFPRPLLSFLSGSPVGAANRRVAMMGNFETHTKRTMVHQVRPPSSESINDRFAYITHPIPSFSVPLRRCTTAHLKSSLTSCRLLDEGSRE